MARLPRLVVPGHLHLLMQRAPAGRTVFQGDEDFHAYRRALAASLAEHGLALHAWALLPAQVLLLATPREANGPSRLLQAVGRRFGGDYNRRHGRSGALWDGRFRAAVVDPAWLMDATRYVEAAPVRAALVAEAAEYPWSSAAHHVGARTDAELTEHRRYWSLGNTPFEREATYRALLAQPLPAAVLARLEGAVATGWAVGERHFLDQLAAQAPRRVAPLARGRPRRAPPGGGASRTSTGPAAGKTVPKKVADDETTQ